MIRRKLAAIHNLLLQMYKYIRIFVTKIMVLSKEIIKYRSQNQMTKNNFQTKKYTEQRRYPQRVRKQTSFYGINN